LLRDTGHSSLSRGGQKVRCMKEGEEREGMRSHSVFRMKRKRNLSKKLTRYVIESLLGRKATELCNTERRRECVMKLRQKVDDPEQAEAIVKLLARYHHRYKFSDDVRCIFKGPHNLLYLALQLAFLWRLENPNTIDFLLRTLYECEGSFSVIIGAPIPTSPDLNKTPLSEFGSKAESLEAAEWFLKVSASLERRWGPDDLLMADVPLKGALFRDLTAVAAAAARGDHVCMALFLKWGAKGEVAVGPLATAVAYRVDDERAAKGFRECETLLSRALPQPISSLKHLARVSLRSLLSKMGSLPLTPSLSHSIPLSLIQYVNLESD